MCTIIVDICKDDSHKRLKWLNIINNYRSTLVKKKPCLMLLYKWNKQKHLRFMSRSLNVLQLVHMSDILSVGSWSSFKLKHHNICPHDWTVLNSACSLEYNWLSTHTWKSLIKFCIYTIYRIKYFSVLMSLTYFDLRQSFSSQ